MTVVLVVAILGEKTGTRDVTNVLPEFAGNDSFRYVTSGNGG